MGGGVRNRIPSRPRQHRALKKKLPIPAWVSLVFGIGLWLVAAALWFSFQKAAIYVCYYGVSDPLPLPINDRDAYRFLFVNGSLVKDPDGFKSIDSLRCLPAPVNESFVCPAGLYDRTQYLGVNFFTTGDVRDINSYFNLSVP